MILETYAALKAAVAGWIHRDDLDERVPEFIRLAELDMNRRLKVVAKEVSAHLVTVPGSRFVALPADFGSPIALSANGWPLAARTAANMHIDDELSTLPIEWAVDGSNITFNCLADKAYPIVLRYLQGLFLSDAAPTNALFVQAPDLYLYGALSHSAPYTQDDGRLPMWSAKYEALLRQVAAEGARALSMAPLQTELPGAMCRSANTRYWG